MIILVHESAHLGVSPNRGLNDFLGMVAGTVTLSPMSVYRMLHKQHHGMLGTETDLEFWPYVNRAVSRPKRVLALVTELTLASPYFICMFTRAILVGRMPDQMRRRCWYELIAGMAVAAAVIVLTVVNGWWAPFLIAYLITLQLAGLLVSYRRMIEHLGLFDEDVQKMTRLVIPTSSFEKFICGLFFNEPYHAAHHRKPSIEWTKLPQVSEEMLQANAELKALHYTGYLEALPDMLRHLSNPRIGKQWLA
jgi:fatty acid desaturase